MKEKLLQFMAGRNGNDEFNRFILVVDLLLILLSTFLRNAFGSILMTFALLLIAFTYYRMLSRNLMRRSDENARYLREKEKVQAALRLLKERWTQRKEYKFFVCPSCRTTLRVPRGRGKIKIVCRKCGHSFTGKS
ncbi:MAG: hypothetical protein K6C08_10055 [Oscillospiraceae bacterium]|nr:hypothetical protein [Oscillospiraceae bacterium]